MLRINDSVEGATVAPATPSTGQPLDVAQHDHLTLHHGQRCDGLLQRRPELAPLELLLR